MIQSKHIVTDVSIYEKSYLKAFELFYGKIEEYCILGLLPSYLERDGSSLIHMIDDLIKLTKLFSLPLSPIICGILNTI